MKKYSLLLIFIALIFLGKNEAQSCLPDGIHFSTQEQIDSFPINYPACFQIIGEVEIKEGIYDTITNLDGLSQITSIIGNLNVINNELLPSMIGVGNLTAIGGNLLIFGNNSLTSMRGLESLTSVGGGLLINENIYLSTLDGLDNLTSIAGRLYVYENASLENLNSLVNVASIGGYLKVQNNPSLKSLRGLNGVVSVGEYVDVYNNPSLINLNELKNLNPIERKIYEKKQPHKVWITSVDKSLYAKGYLRAIEDSVIMISNDLNKLESNYITQNINIQSVDIIGFRKKGQVGRSILFGAFTGMAVGAITGLYMGDDIPGIDCKTNAGTISGQILNILDPCFSAGDKAVFVGAPLGTVGAFIGGIAGSIKIKIPLNGNQKNFRKHKGELLKYKIRD